MSVPVTQLKPAKVNGSKPAVTASPVTREEATQLYLDSLAAGEPLSGVDLAGRCGRSVWWARDVIRNCRGEEPGNALAPASQATRRVTVAAAVGSYWHMPESRLSAGEGVACLAAAVLSERDSGAASMTALVRRRQGLKVGFLVRFSFGLGVAASPRTWPRPNRPSRGVPDRRLVADGLVAGVRDAARPASTPGEAMTGEPSSRDWCDSGGQRPNERGQAFVYDQSL